MTDYRQIIQKLESLERDTLLKISGYIDALIGHSATNQNQALTKEAEITNAIKNISVVFASQTGNAEEIAQSTAQYLNDNGFSTNVKNCAELSTKKLASISHLILVASTHGEGEPPDNAIQFYEQLKSTRANKLNNTQFGIIALGDSSYEQYCGFGVWLDERLTELGATKIIDTLLADVDYESAVTEWQQKLFNKLSSVSSVFNSPVNSGSERLQQSTKYSIANPYQSEVIQNIDLCMPQAGKSIHHLELDLPTTHISYEPGDSLGIVSPNPSNIVEAIINQLNTTKESKVILNQKTVTVEECLTDSLEIFRLTNKQTNLFFEQYPNKKLQSLWQKNKDDFIFKHDILSLLMEYPQNEIFKDIQSFINLLNPQGQRLYSISSSPKAQEDEVHLTIRLREFGADNRLGLVSSYIANIEEGSSLKIYLKPNKNFRLPKDSSAPLILIGAGTGVAPFRSFLYHRLEEKNTSPSWLFFGEQYFSHSFLYQNDWHHFLDKKVLSKMTVAFSRDGEKPIYVQDKLKQHSKEVYQWIEEGAYIYVCGSADGMASEVHSTLENIIADQSGVTLDVAKQKLQSMLINGLYKRDIY